MNLEVHAWEPDGAGDVLISTLGLQFLFSNQLVVDQQRKTPGCLPYLRDEQA